MSWANEFQSIQSIENTLSISMSENIFLPSFGAKGIASVCDDVRFSFATTIHFSTRFSSVLLMYCTLGWEMNERVFLTLSRKINADSFFCVYFLLQEIVAAGKCTDSPRDIRNRNTFDFPSPIVCVMHIHHHIRFDSLTNETPWTDFMLLRIMHACHICCSPDTFVRNSIDSVTTIRARIHCTQREKSFDVPRLSACLTENPNHTKDAQRLHISHGRA